MLFRSINDYAIGSGGHIYLSSYNWIFRSKTPVNSVENSFVATNEKILSVSPNPINSTGEFTFSLTKNSRIEIILYDLLGIKVHTLFCGFKHSGDCSIPFSIEVVPNGVY